MIVGPGTKKVSQLLIKTLGLGFNYVAAIVGYANKTHKM